MVTYHDAAEYLGRKTSRPLPGPSTRIERRDDDRIAVRYHQTDVVTYHDDGRIVLDSGGYQTATTKTRINDYAPVSLWQRRGNWFLNDGEPFADGVTLTNGAITYPEGIDPDTLQRDRDELARQIRTYAAGFGAAVARGEVGEPGGGDCWGCLFARALDPHTFALGTDHLRSHFGHTDDDPDPYYVPSLLLRAFGTHGDPGVCFRLCLDRHDGTEAARVIRGFLRRVLLDGCGR